MGQLNIVEQIETEYQEGKLTYREKLDLLSQAVSQGLVRVPRPADREREKQYIGPDGNRVSPELYLKACADCGCNIMHRPNQTKRCFECAYKRKMKRAREKKKGV